VQQSKRRYDEPGLRVEHTHGDRRRQPGTLPTEQHAGGRAPAIASPQSRSGGHDTRTTPSRDQQPANSQPPPPWQAPRSDAHGLPAPQPWHTASAPPLPTHVAGIASSVPSATQSGVGSAWPAPLQHGRRAHDAASMSPVPLTGTPCVLPPPPGPGVGANATVSPASGRDDAGRPASAPPWLDHGSPAWPVPRSGETPAEPAATRRRVEQLGQPELFTAGGTNTLPGDDRTGHASADALRYIEPRAAVSEASAQPLRQDKAGPERRRDRHAPSKELQKQVRQPQPDHI